MSPFSEAEGAVHPPESDISSPETRSAEGELGEPAPRARSGGAAAFRRSLSSIEKPLTLEHTVALVWASFVIAPALVYGRTSPEVTATLSLIWIAGCCLLVVALRRERERKVLEGLRATRLARVALVLFLLLFQYATIRLSGTTAAFILMVAFLMPLALWAFSPSPAALVRKSINLGLVLASAAVCAAGLEGGLRITEAIRPLNDIKTATWGHPVVNNRLGFRERDFAVPKPPGTYRVMVLGDSFTWGAGLAEEERYTNLVEAELARQLAGTRVEVLNFGLPDATTVRERDVLRRHVDLVEPDLIVVGFCVNDPQPRRQEYAVEEERFAILFFTVRQLRSLGLSRSSKFLKIKLDQTLRAIGLIPHWQVALDRTYDSRSDEWQAFVRALRDVKAVSDVRQLEPPLFVPLLFGSGDFNRPDEHLTWVLKWNSQAETAARGAGLRTLNLEEDFKRQGERDRAVNPWDDHPDAESNRIYARAITAAVLETIRSR